MSVVAIPEGHLLRCDLKCGAEWDDDSATSPTAVREYASWWGWSVPSPHDDPGDRWYGLDVCPSCIKDAADRMDAAIDASAKAADGERPDPRRALPTAR